MVAKGSDLVQTALFVKRAFIELLKKVVSKIVISSTKYVLTVSIGIHRASVRNRLWNSCKRPEANVPSVMTHTLRPCCSCAVIFSANSVSAHGSIENKLVLYAEPRSLMIRHGVTEPPLYLCNCIKLISLFCLCV